MNGYQPIFDVDLDAMDLGKEEAAKLVPAFALQDVVIDYFYGESSTAGIHLPWSKTHANLRLRPGEVSIWAGVNGHGKSLLLNQIMLQAMANDERVCIASMEMKPHITMARMVRQACGAREPSIPFIKRFHEWTEGRLWLYDQQGTVKSDRIIALLAYCGKVGAQDYNSGKKVKITHIVIDSLMKCGIGVDDYNRQKAFVDELCAAAKDTGAHIHLVAHARKGESERKIQDKFDIKGTSEITDQVDNVFTVWRNKRKEDESQKQNPDEETMKEPDALLICSKQRHGEWEGKITLWFHKDSTQYVASDGARPIDFLSNHEAYAERTAIRA